MTDNSVGSIAQCLEQSLLPQYAKDAENQLRSIESTPQFSMNLMKIMTSNDFSNAVRLAAALFFKNLLKRKWINENGEYLLPVEECNYIKGEILNVMIILPSNLQVQVGECISIIAELDFPHNWNNLIDELISKFSVEDFKTNKSILLVSHSIFKKWRPLFRSDELFLEIKMVLDKFAQPFLMLLNKIDELIEVAIKQQNGNDLQIYLENLHLLIQIYYDLNCQDIPEFFEDNMVDGMKILHKYLQFNSQLISNDDDDDEINIVIKIKTSIIELVNLYITRYTEVFEPLIENFINIIWELITTGITKQQKFDLLIVKCLQLLTSIIKLSNYQKFFNNENSLNEVLERIILPNIYLRDVDLEMFEDEPINFVRFDLEGSEFDSRRKSATDFLRELKEVNNELLTSIVTKYVDNFLKVGDGNWQNKDIAIYLFSSLAAKGSVTNIGVTSTNVLVDVVQFFTNNIANDLVSQSGNQTHPILITDSIKYILIFRNQLTKDQLLSVIPLLINHLKSDNPVIFTYSAITIEKLLSMTSFSDLNHKPIFDKFDLQPYINELLTNLFKLINLSSGNAPEKLSENEFLIKCVMRILNTGEDSISSDFKSLILNQIISILKIISKNPANPRFSHYTFESLGLLIKYSKSEEINGLIEIVLPNLLNVLNDDVQEFVPYSFQILAYLLEKLPPQQSLPQDYNSLIKPLMSPNLWQFRGNIPGITRLLVSIIRFDAKVFGGSNESITPLLGIFQKLIASKVNDIYGFELLEAILLYIPVENLQNYLKDISILLLTRLKNLRTDKFLKRFIIFVFSLCSIPLNSKLNQQINGDFVINLINLPQPGVFNLMLNNLVLPNLLNFQNLNDKKIILIGLLELINCQQTTGDLKLILLQQLTKNLTGLESLKKDNSLINDQSGLITAAPLNELDIDTGSFGSSFSKLVSIQSTNFDPLVDVKSNDFGSIKLIVSGNLSKVDPSILLQLPSETQQTLKELI